MQADQLTHPSINFKKQVVTFALIYLCYLLAFFCRMMISPLLPLVADELVLTKAQMGGFVSAFYFGYIFTNLPGGLLTNYYGYRRVLLGTLFFIGIATISFGFVHDYNWGLFVRFLDGIGSGATFSACLRAIFEWFPKSRGFATGLLQTGTTGGVMLSNLITPSFAQYFDWHITFFAMGAVPLVVLVFVYFFLTELPQTKEQTQKTKENNALFWKDVFTMFKNKNLIILSISGFFAMAATWGTAAWANTYLVSDLHVELVTAGFWMALYGLASVATKPISGFITDKFTPHNRRYLLTLLLILLAPALIAFALNKNTDLLYVLVPLLGIFAFSYSPVMNAFIGDLVPVEKTGAAAGFLNTIWQMGSLASPIVVGKILDHFGDNYFYAFSTLAISAVISGITILFIKVR